MTISPPPPPRTTAPWQFPPRQLPHWTIPYEGQLPPVNSTPRATIPPSKVRFWICPGRGELPKGIFEGQLSYGAIVLGVDVRGTSVLRGGNCPGGQVVLVAIVRERGWVCPRILLYVAQLIDLKSVYIFHRSI